MCFFFYEIYSNFLEAAIPKIWTALAYQIDACIVVPPFSEGEGGDFPRLFDSGSCVIPVRVEMASSCTARRWIAYHKQTVLNQDYI